MAYYLPWLKNAPAGGGACDVTAASCSEADVLAALALASPGQRVCVPAGTASWSGGISLSGKELVGAGKSTSGTVITAGTVSITKHATEVTRLSGIRFTANAEHIDVGGDPANAFYIVDNCHLANDGAVMCSIATNGGLWTGVDFVAATAHSSDVFAINLGGVGTAGEDSWQAATTMGADDTTGQVNTYFENCTWTNFLEVAGDIDNGARVVYRYCTFNDSSLVQHGGGSGTSGQDTSAYGGRHVEVYNCTFNRADINVPVNKWLWVRGSTGVFIDNDLDEASSSEYGGKVEIRFTVGCPGEAAYALAYQVGQSTQTPDSTPNQPFIISGNTGAGAAHSSGFPSISGESGEGITCAIPTTYIQAGRDYVTSNTWGYTKYTYPHPLTPA